MNISNLNTADLTIQCVSRRLPDLFALAGVQPLGQPSARLDQADARQNIPDVPITMITDDSRRVQPGACFVCVKGRGFDGHQFIDQALAAGAAAVVVERVQTGADKNITTLSVSAHRDAAQARSYPKIPNSKTARTKARGSMYFEAYSSTSHPVMIPVADSRSALAKLASAFHGLASHGLTPALATTTAGNLRIIGITGTNGKSTVAWMLRSILQHTGRKPALLGTIEYDLVGKQIIAPLTTPSPVDLYSHLETAKHFGATDAVLEVSSHALDQRRCDGLEFAAGVFTNLSGDHLDYHLTMEAYAAAKRRLFESLSPDAVAVINADDPIGLSMIEGLHCRVVRYGLNSRHDLNNQRNGTVLGYIESMNVTGSLIRLQGQTFEASAKLSLVGEHNVYNVLSAVAAAEALGIEPETIITGLEAVTGVPGRLQHVESVGAQADAFSVFVDYAHTDDALRNVLRTLRSITKGRLLCVFGCGGDRDRSKRPRMAAAVAELADIAFVTSDNPRTENPMAIINDILSGFSRHASISIRVDPDRRTAIESAITSAKPGDTVLIAGKGHETYQLVKNQAFPFDDRKIAGEILNHREKPEVTP